MDVGHVRLVHVGHDPDRGEVGDGEQRVGGIPGDGVADGHVPFDDGAGDRRLQDVVGLASLTTERPERPVRAVLLGAGLGEGRRGLLALHHAAGALLDQHGGPGGGLLGEQAGLSRLGELGLGGREIGRVDREEHLARADVIARHDVDRGDASAHGRPDRGEVSLVEGHAGEEAPRGRRGGGLRGLDDHVLPARSREHDGAVRAPLMGRAVVGDGAPRTGREPGGEERDGEFPCEGHGRDGTGDVGEIRHGRPFRLDQTHYAFVMGRA